MSARIIYPDTYNRFADSKKITLDKILQALNGGAGGGGSGGVTAGDVVNIIYGHLQVYTGAAPPAAPDDPAIAAVFYPEYGGSIQQWDIATQTWV